MTTANTDAEQQDKKEAETLAAEYARHAAAAKPHLDEMNRIKSRFRELLDYGTHEAGNLSVGIQRNSRFDDKAFQAKYPVELNPTFYKPVVDRTQVSDAVAAEFMKQGEPKVVIK